MIKFIPSIPNEQYEIPEKTLYYAGFQIANSSVTNLLTQPKTKHQLVNRVGTHSKIKRLSETEDIGKLL